jgi:hypothetical protein
MKKWTETKARKVVGTDKITDKHVVVRGGLSGLTACSALDFLTNHCKYTVAFVRGD